MTSVRTPLVVLLAVACAGLGIKVVAMSERAPAESHQLPPASTAAPVTDGPVAVLRRWDRERAEAWAAGDVRRLRSLYAPRSTAADRDVAMLRRWVDRGQRAHLETQLLRTRVVGETDDRLVLAVTDRVTRAVTDDGRPLPADVSTRWRITLHRIGGEWRVAAVTR